MAYKVTIKPSENSFTAEEGETILAAAMRAGYTLPYGCKNGACAACKGKVLEGNIDHGSPQISALADFEKNDGLTLFCQATPKSDLIIEGREIESNATIEVRRLPSRVQEIRRVTDDVVILKLKLPANQEFIFLAGQYIDVLLREGKRRSYSMGNSPHNNEYIELHVRSMANGTFTKQVFETLKEKGRSVSQAALPVSRRLHIHIGRFRNFQTGGLSPDRVLTRRPLHLGTVANCCPNRTRWSPISARWDH